MSVVQGKFEGIFFPVALNPYYNHPKLQRKRIYTLFFPTADSGDVSSIKDVARLELLADVRPIISSWRKSTNALTNFLSVWVIS